MAQAKIILYKWKTLKSGNHPILLRVLKDNQRMTFSTGLSCRPPKKPTPSNPDPPTYWNDEYGLFVVDKRLNPNYKLDNETLTNIKAKADKIIKEFDRLDIDFTLTQFEREFEKKTINLSPADYFDRHIENLMKSEKYGNADVFRCTMRILKIFDKKFEKKKFPDIDQRYIERFDAFLRNDRGLKDTSISVYMRTFAALLNAAIKDDLMPQGAYPFNGKGYKIRDLNTKTRKRFIPVEYLKTLKNYQFKDLRLETARNQFLFSFYCRGMNWVDMALLTPSNLHKDLSESGKQITVIKYTRQKTHKEYEIIVNKDIQDLLDWFRVMPHSKQYLLPIISVPENEGEALRLHIKERLHKHNKALSDIAEIEELKFPDALHKITSYFSRHSYAMALRSNGTNIELIQESLGHSDLNTTKIYLDSFGREAVSNASENLI